MPLSGRPRSAVVKYRAWIPRRETEGEGADYDDGPGLAAEQHAEACYYDDNCPNEVVVNVRRVGAYEVLAFNVWVEHNPVFCSSLRKDAGVSWRTEDP
jgi:hypothetical protein